ncbi:hypothetical protein V9T40_014489 [Parthenolecanium corni]|uniref:Uncharacterized protein n=1 Tax=Parthenolecanium corni TaxID=536013 RepID=A0AAN9T517_9HEMI
MEVNEKRSSENFIGGGTIRKYYRLLRRFKLRKLRSSPPPNEEPPPIPRPAVPEKYRYALKADVDYEFRKLDLFRRCEGKIEELNRIFVRYSNHKTTPSPRSTISKEMVMRNIMRRLRTVDVQMKALMEDIQAKKLELQRLKGDVDKMEE